MNAQQLAKIEHGIGLFAALDQSGGSTPQSLARYGIVPGSYTGDAEMFELMHQMRTRIITSPSFGGDRVLGVILFEDTTERSIDGRPSVDYCWVVKQVVPFLKVDRGLVDEHDGVQLMKPIPGLDATLQRAVDAGVFGTKARSFIKLADVASIGALVDQQFEVGHQVLAHGLAPILEPEIDIRSPQKAAAEAALRDALLEHLARLDATERVLLKLTLPETGGFYTSLVQHPNVIRVLALSGGYSRDDAVARLAVNPGVVASFSRGLTEGLSAAQSDADFDSTLDAAFAEIVGAGNL